MTDRAQHQRRTVSENVQRSFAPALNAVTWALLQNKQRSTADNEKMLYAAFASAFHYLETGNHADHQRAEWLISRVYSTLGNGREAVRHANRCLELTEQYAAELQDYDRAFACEAAARANAVEGDSRAAEKYFRMAIDAGRKIADPDHRKQFEAEFRGGDWYGVASGVFSLEA